MATSRSVSESDVHCSYEDGIEIFSDDESPSQQVSVADCVLGLGAFSSGLDHACFDLQTSEDVTDDVLAYVDQTNNSEGNDQEVDLVSFKCDDGY